MSQKVFSCVISFDANNNPMRGHPARLMLTSRLLTAVGLTVWLGSDGAGCEQDRSPCGASQALAPRPTTFSEQSPGWWLVWTWLVLCIPAPSYWSAFPSLPANPYSSWRRLPQGFFHVFLPSCSSRALCSFSCLLSHFIDPSAKCWDL
jgi:hypothetical protein